ncbi:MAG TPA: hypothetical protein DCY88_00105, partial [Cyanobacteria bacterium UBA11372]|nr:hypothetical protein [Cyanobacteria bacterium UBA11372]
QFHPEFQSRPSNPHPLFKGFISAALAKVDQRGNGKGNGEVAITDSTDSSDVVSGEKIEISDGNPNSTWKAIAELS